MAKALKVSRRSIGRVVKNDLEMRSFKRKRVHHLTALVKEKELREARDCLRGTRSMVSNHFCSQMRNYSPLRRQRTLKMIVSSLPQFHLSQKNFDMSAVYKSHSQSWFGREYHQLAGHHSYSCL